jgi:hypothetical protein
MAVVRKGTNSQRVRVALYVVLAPSNAARGFTRLPFGTPQSQIQHLSRALKKAGDTLRLVLYFFRE